MKTYSLNLTEGELLMCEDIFGYIDETDDMRLLYQLRDFERHDTDVQSFFAVLEKIQNLIEDKIIQ